MSLSEVKSILHGLRNCVIASQPANVRVRTEARNCGDDEGSGTKEKDGNLAAAVGLCLNFRKSAIISWLITKRRLYEESQRKCSSRRKVANVGRAGEGCRCWVFFLERENNMAAVELEWIPETLYNTAISAVVDNYSRSRRDIRSLPENIQFDVYYKVRYIVPLW